MQRVKAVQNESPPQTNNKTKNMKTLKNLALAAVILCASLAARAGTVNGYFRSNGTYVLPHYRTPANATPYENLSYRGYPSQQPGYVSPRSYGLDSSWSRPTPLPNYGNYDFSKGLQPFTGDYAPKPLRRSNSLGF